MDSTKKKELLLSIVALAVIVGAAFWFFPSFRYLFFKQPSGPHQTALEKFDYLFVGNHYGKLSLDRYDNFRLISLGGDKKILTALFQVPQSVAEAKTVLRAYLNSNKYTFVREQSVEDGVQLFGQLYDQPILIKITKVSDKVSEIAFIFQEKYVIQALSYDKLPSNFPADIPVEYDAIVIQNESVLINGKTQGTFTIQSANTLDENFEEYQGYFSQGDWKIAGQVNDSKLPVKSILAFNKTGTMSLNITPGRSPRTSVVSLIFLTSPR